MEKRNISPISKPSSPNYKRPNFLTGFHHTAYLETVQKVQNKSKAVNSKFKSLSPYLPKIPYLMKKPIVNNSMKECLKEYHKLKEEYEYSKYKISNTEHIIENAFRKKSESAYCLKQIRYKQEELLERVPDPQMSRSENFVTHHELINKSNEDRERKSNASSKHSLEAKKSCQKLPKKLPLDHALVKNLLEGLDLNKTPPQQSSALNKNKSVSLVPSKCSSGFNRTPVELNVTPNHQQPKVNTVDIFLSNQEALPNVGQKISSETIASNVSKRSNSAPPTKFQRRFRNPRDIELRNPIVKSAAIGQINRSIIDSIRTRIFCDLEQNTNHAQEPSSWDDQEYDNYDKDNLKFPRETKTAMMIMIRNSKDGKVKNKQKQDKKVVDEAETQTSPIHSSIIAVDDNLLNNVSNLPCTKNLLCKKGLHSGKCSRMLRGFRSCSEDCICKNKNYWCPECMSRWAGPENGNYKNLGRKKLTQRFPRGSGEPPDILQHVLVLEDLLNTKVIPSQSTMNGMNGHTNGELNGCDIITQNQQKGCWTIGLINSKFRYLTAETFGFKINANGSSLKKKQIWTLEPDHANGGGESYIYLRSHLDKYLAVDSFGNVTCESDEKDPGCKFQISVAEDGSGRWAFRNVVRGYFLGSSSDKLTCTAKVPGDAEFWHVHLAARPQVNLRSVGRKRFAHLSENLDEIHVDANIPWGEDTLFTLEFRADESGKYALHTCNNKYLSSGGKLVDICNKDCLFTAEYHSGQLALRDRNGAYLSPIGSKAILKTRSNTVTKDELFSLEDSLPQASFVAALNSRYVSVKQGVDVTANQDEISDHETFQLEFDWSTKRWYIRTMQDRYWTLETGGGIQAVGDKRSSNALFDLIWQGDGSVAFRANNGRYVITKRSGHLYATADSIDENCKYFFYLINRPILVLKSEQGFVGYKSSSSPKLECNKATYETIQVERAEKGVIHFKGQNGKYWHCDSEGVTADSDVPEGFYLELREPTRLSIKSVSGSYLTASKNGSFRLGESSFETATQWEY